MKNIKKLFPIAVAVALFLGGVAMTAGAETPARKIVVFKTGVVNDGAKEATIKKFGGVKIKNLNLINAKAVLLSQKAEAELSRDASVLRVDDDVVVEALEAGAKGKFAGQTSSPQPAQVLPWGIERVGASAVWSTTVGDPIRVGIVDTGIDLSHPDLSVNIKGGYNAIISGKSANDDNGHGTHVAGIIAAVNNSIGVVGMAPAADLYAIKVLNRNGSGWLSDIIEGIDWAIANRIQVINMSLGTSSDVQSFHDAIIRAAQAGIVQVAAAGNNGGAVIYPAAYPEVIAVSATDNTNTLATWSSRGQQVDLAAPGVSIFSTYKGQTYATLSGTSMASPHVAGAAALLLSVPSKCDLNLDGVCTSAEVQARLESTATDLGAVGKDSLYGSGLLNVVAALQ